MTPWDDSTEVLGEQGSSFEAADADLRRQSQPRAVHYLARASALRAEGARSAADDDLRQAFRLEPFDPAVLGAVLDLHGDPRLRATAARVAIDDEGVPATIIDRAVAILLDQGQDPILTARRYGTLVAGWVASRSAPIPRVWAEAEDGARLPVDVDDAISGRQASYRVGWRIRDQGLHDGVALIRAVSAAGCSAALAVPARDPAPDTRGSTTVTPRAGSGVTIVIPVFGDIDSLSACLASVERQEGPDIRVIVVDDASPFVEVSRMAMAFCRRQRRLYIRNTTNRGFAVSVNAALARAGDADVLLLNSDVTLPDRAVERLRHAAHAEADVGIASPLSNDVGNASFPDPLVPHRALPPADALRIDRAAERVNRGVLVDMPSVHGSCLYLRRDCLDRVGSLSTAYGRGYFEDVDLCLRAREAGFRVVAACGIYVSHQSGRSFGPDRYPLIARNIGVLERRFPGHRTEDAAHDRADPLRPARAAIEEAEPLLHCPVILIVGRGTMCGALLRERARAAGRDGAAALTLSWSTMGEGATCSVVSEDERGPRSLTFPVDASGLSRLGDYLGRLPLTAIELCEIDALPDALAEQLSAAGAAMTIVIDGLPALDALRAPGRAWCRLSRSTPIRLVATDDMARAAAAIWIGKGEIAGFDVTALDAAPASDPAPAEAATAVISGCPDDTCGPAPEMWRDVPPGARAPRITGPLRLGVPLPETCFDAERLLLALARCLRGRPVARLLVFGAPANASQLASTGTCWMSGSMRLDEVAGALARYGIDRLLLPYRGSHHWVLDVLGGHGLPGAYFDWSPSGRQILRHDLALAPAESVDESSERLLAWLAADRPGIDDGPHASRARSQNVSG